MAKAAKKAVRKRGSNLFKRNDIMRAIKSARDAGVLVAGVEITCKDGTVIRVLGPDAVASSDRANPWDEVSKNAADKKRSS